MSWPGRACPRWPGSTRRAAGLRRPLVVAAVILDPRELSGLSGVADSKTLTAAAREEAYAEVMRTALSWHRVIIPAAEIDACGLHVCNIAGMRRALAGLSTRPGYVLTDGFAVRGLGVPALAMWKGDEVAACVAAASIVAKVTRDRIMTGLSEQYPAYGFARHITQARDRNSFSHVTILPMSCPRLQASHRSDRYRADHSYPICDLGRSHSRFHRTRTIGNRTYLSQFVRSVYVSEWIRP